MKPSLLGLTLAFVVAGCGRRGDARLQEGLTGTWVATGSYANGESFKSTVAISPNGNYLVVFSKPGQNRTNSMEGTLRVRDGQVIDTVIKRNTINQTAPTSTRARIVRLDGRERCFCTGTSQRAWCRQQMTWSSERLRNDG
jgi:predicted TIM-barrel enzyme